MKFLIFILLALCAVFASDQGNSKLKPSIETLEENFAQQGTSIQQLRENLNLIREKLEIYQENYNKSILKPSTLETLQEIVAQQDARCCPSHEKQMMQSNFLENPLAFRAKKKAKLLGPLALDLVESYSMPQTALKMKMSDKQWSKISGNYFMNVFPNETSIQLFRHVETNKTFWVDEENSLDDNLKKQIEACLLKEEKEEINVEGRTDDGWTALHYAAYYGSMSATKALLGNNANINPINFGEYTPLMHAAQMGHDDVVKLLLERGADAKIEHSDGWTALDSARNHGTQTSAHLLEDHLAKLRK